MSQQPCRIDIEGIYSREGKRHDTHSWGRVLIVGIILIRYDKPDPKSLLENALLGNAVRAYTHTVFK